MVVSVVHVVKGSVDAPVLDGQPVRRISAYLVEGDLDTSPSALVAERSEGISGFDRAWHGFHFRRCRRRKGEAERLERCSTLIENDPRNAERIIPYIGGEEINN